jgi:hypothetical protein
LPPAIQNTQQSLVLIAYSAYALTNEPKPQSYLIPFFPSGWHFIGIPFSDLTPAHLQPNEYVKITNIIRHTHSRIYILATNKVIPSFYLATNAFGLAPDDHCQDIASSRQLISNSETWICPMKRKG